MASTQIHKQWEPFVVLISYSVSALGSYTTLQIISQTRYTASRMFNLQMWLLFASLTFGGCAVWSMHFLGMMALNLSMEVGYEPVLTVISLLVPVVASRVAFEFMQFSSVSDASLQKICESDDSAHSRESSAGRSRGGSVARSRDEDAVHGEGDAVREQVEDALLVDEELTEITTMDMEHEPEATKSPQDILPIRARCTRVARVVRYSAHSMIHNMRKIPCWRIAIGGVFLAMGIFAMHFIGMLAMRMDAIVVWDWGYIVTSFIVAWMAASTSLYIVSFCYMLWQQFLAALLMSLAVCGMHYVGMAAATYYTTNTSPTRVAQGGMVLNDNFASVISIVSTITSFVFFGLASGNTTIARDRLVREIELRKTMEKLMLEKEAAELADRTKSAFVATVSHEIRTPMNIIIGATELLSSTRQSEEQKELTNTIQASSRGLLSMINDILDFSKLNNNRMQLEKLGFSPAEVVEDIVSMSVVSAPPNVDLLLRVSPNANMRVLGDPVRFQQVVLNIVSNAMKFTEKGYILLDMYCTERTTTTCKMVVAIEDSGIGIAQEACGKIFEPFVQADSSYARRFGGTGLGLSVCKQLVELMGGSIHVDSVVNQGTLFQCDIPFTLDDTQSEHPSRVDEYKGLRCFLACRNARSQEILKSFLQKWGMTVFDHTIEDSTPTQSDFTHFDVIIIDMELLSNFQLADCDKPIIITNPHRQRPAGLSPRTVFVRRPVFEDRLYISVHQAIRNSATPSPFSSPLVSPVNSPTQIYHANGPLNPLGLPKILLVEDNRLVQQIAIRLLRKLGLEVEVAENGLEAVNMITKVTYQAVFMDCQMPVMDGFEATKKIRQIEKDQHLPRTKIIALTAGVSEELKKECIKVGMDTYITKPVTLHMLRRALEIDDSGVGKL